MALPFSNHVLAVTNDIIESSIEDVVFTGNPTLELLKERGSVVSSGAPFIRFPIFSDDTNAAGQYSGYDILDTTPNENINSLKYRWGHKYAHVIISETEMLENDGEQAIINLVKGKAENAMSTMLNLISVDIFSTNGDSSFPGINGLRAIVDSTGAIGSVNASDLASWASEEDASTTTLTVAAMEQSWLDASVGNEAPDFVVTTKGVYKKYKDVLQNVQRFGEGKTAKGGFRYVMFNEMPMFWDINCPGSGSGSADNHLFLLNSKYLKFYIHKKNNFKMQDLPKPWSQAVIGQRLTFSGQLVTNNRRMHGKMSTLQH